MWEEERGRTDLNHESHPAKRVVVEHDAANVAGNLGHTAKNHAAHEAPCAPADAEDDVDKGNGAKDGQQGNVGGQRGAVGVDAPFDGARVEGAGDVGAKGDDAGGEASHGGGVGVGEADELGDVIDWRVSL